MSIIGKTCIVRTQTAGVFLGTVAQRNGKEATLTNAEIGRQIARENAVDKVWPLMGYELRSKLAAA